MKKIYLFILSVFLLSTNFFAQETERQKGHYNISKFKQLHEELPTPNSVHTASGAPGYEYSQQKVDYKIDIVLDDENQRIYGEEIIIYHNNSQDSLEYLWLQLDQNKRAADSTKSQISVTSSIKTYLYPVTASFFRSLFSEAIESEAVAFI